MSVISSSGVLRGIQRRGLDRRAEGGSRSRRSGIDSVVCQLESMGRELNAAVRARGPSRLRRALGHLDRAEKVLVQALTDARGLRAAEYAEVDPIDELITARNMVRDRLSLGHEFDAHTHQLNLWRLHRDGFLAAYGTTARGAASVPAAHSASLGMEMGSGASRRGWGMPVAALAAVVAIVAIGLSSGQQGAGPSGPDSFTGGGTSTSTPSSTSTRSSTSAPPSTRDVGRQAAAIVELAPKAKPAVDELVRSGRATDSFQGMTVLDALEALGQGSLEAGVKPRAAVVDLANMVAFPQRIQQAWNQKNCTSPIVQGDHALRFPGRTAVLTMKLLTEGRADAGGEDSLQLQRDYIDSPGIGIGPAVSAYQMAIYANMLRREEHPQTIAEAIARDDEGANSAGVYQLMKYTFGEENDYWMDGKFIQSGADILDALDRAAADPSGIYLGIWLADGEPHYMEYRGKEDGHYILLDRAELTSHAMGQAEGYDRKAGLDYRGEPGRARMTRSDLESHLRNAFGPQGKLGALTRG